MRHNEKSENIARRRRLLVVASQTVGVVAVHRPHRRPNPLQTTFSRTRGEILRNFHENLSKTQSKLLDNIIFFKVFPKNAKQFDEILLKY